MTPALLTLLAVAIVLLVVARRRYRHWRLYGGDPAWKPTTHRFTTDATYDQQKAVAGVKRSRQQTASGRTIRRASKPKAATVTPFRKVGR